MGKKIFITIIIAVHVFIINCSSNIELKKNNSKPFLSKKAFVNSDRIKNAEKKLIIKTKNKLNKTFRTVVDKTILPTSGDKHDYMSTAVYFWPESDKKNSKWVVRDGEVNVESLKQTDHYVFSEAMKAIRDLSLSYYLTNNEDFAKKAFTIIDQWFINPKTKMNPNFNHAQAIPNLRTGTHGGIISSRLIIWIINSFDYLEKSKHLSNSDYNLFKGWCLEYLNWLVNSKFGKDEAKMENNHGTYYDLIVSSFADFTGDENLCYTTLADIKTKRIGKQIMKDGSMPEELKRTRPIHYTVFNLSALFHSAILGDKYNMNLWEFKNEESGSILESFNYLLTMLENNKTNEKINYSQIIGLVTIANNKFVGNYEVKLNNLLNKNKFHLVDSYFVY